MPSERAASSNGCVFGALFIRVRGETVWKRRIGSILRSHEPAKRGAEHSFRRLALPKNVRSNPSSYFPDSLGRRILRSSFAEECIERPPRGGRIPSEATPAAWEGTTCCG